ncbi:unnamed protein product [Alopecurus aequalis]
MWTQARLTYIPPGSNCRGVAACFPQPVDQDQAVFLRDLIRDANVRRSKEEEDKVQELEYRGSDGDIDILRHVFRWDRTPYPIVFENGLFIPRNLRDKPCFNLKDYVKSGSRRLDTRKETKHGFIITTLNSAWFPDYVDPGSSDILYRYEIYAPGGILVAKTLGDSYRYADAQDEIAFVYGIAPQYIRSAQVFKLSNNRGSPGRQRMDNKIYINTNFNPQSSPQRLLKIQNPVGAYADLLMQRCDLDPQPYPRINSQLYSGQSSNNLLLGASSTHVAHNDPQDDPYLKYYKVGVTYVDSYINAAFRCKGWNQAYIFMKTEYVIINYAPGPAGVCLQPLKYIGEGFPFLAGTTFAEYGIDAAFAFLDGTTEAMIFSGNLCARIDYAPFTTDSRFTKEPKPIREMFPCLKGTGFVEGIDCAFATKGRRAYLFKGTEYALIDHVNGILMATHQIKYGFDVLHGCGFTSDLDAAFATHDEDIVYLFKGNKYLKLYYPIGKTGDKIIQGPETIVSDRWNSLRGLLPRKNIALDHLPGGNGRPDKQGRFFS